MNYEEFKDKVVEDVRRELETRTGKAYDVQARTVEKMNENYDAITVKPEDGIIGVNLNVKELYKAHEDGHSYNHIIFNAFSIDGKKKFRDFYFSGIALRKISDILCVENGLSIIKPAPYKNRKSKGYVTWARRFNAKQMAKTVLFLQQHKIESYEQLKEITDERCGKLKELKDSMKEKEELLSENKKRQQRKSINLCQRDRSSICVSFVMSMATFLKRRKKEFTEYAGINKDIHEYLIAKRNLEMLYLQDKSKNEKEGRDKRSRNSRTESGL